jgi:DNA mismatch repair protein MutS
LYTDDEYLYLDKFTVRNLELIHAMHPEGKSLAEILDNTQTAMGARLLRKWILMPLRNIQLIDNRLNKTQSFIQNPKNLSFLREKLSYIADIERLTAKLSMLKLNPREAVILKNSLALIPEIKECLKELSEFHSIVNQVPDIEEEIKLLENYLLDSPALNSTQGPILKDGVSTELDELRHIQEHAQKKLIQIQQNEALNTGISSLKVDFNKVHGFYIEISKAHKNKLPDYYERRQTLTNAERYITPELKELENKVLTAEEKRILLEQQLYIELLQKLQISLPKFQEISKIIAEIDVLANNAHLAIQRNYTKPQISDTQEIEIIAGRHPVIELMLPADKPYIPNDVYLDNQNQQIIILTGPNMAGKSAFLRQVGIITLMAQAGFFVPAQSAKIGLIDKIFTRVGASDNLSAGESTFMVEMNETARIINNTTPKSLILLDEIGRGTSTFDGISIAWSLVEFLHNEPNYRAKTIFATHYHELAELAKSLPRVKNFNVKVKEIDGRILFLRKLEPGSSEHSFGIQVAAMAGLPKSIIERAKEILLQFENQRLTHQQIATQIPVKTHAVQMRLFELMDEDTLKLRKFFSEIDIDRLTPVEALLKLHELKQMLIKNKPNE